MKVLVAIDDSDCSNSAVAQLVQRDWPGDTEFRVVTVIEPFTYGLMVPMSPQYANSIAEAEREFEAWSKRLVDRAVSEIENNLRCKVSGHVLHGQIAESIVSEACSWGAEVIIVGSHGKKGFQRMFLGSVSEKVVRIAPCSVEVVKDRVAIEGTKKLQQVR